MQAVKNSQKGAILDEISLVAVAFSARANGTAVAAAVSWASGNGRAQNVSQTWETNIIKYRCLTGRRHGY